MTRSYNFNLYEKENVMINAREFNNEMKELRDMVVSEIMKPDAIKYMSESEFLLMRKMINFLDVSIEVFEQQTNTLNAIERKLNMLLSRA